MAIASDTSNAPLPNAPLPIVQRQQVHVEHPTVYTEAERDDSEVGLDDPETTFPIRRLQYSHGVEIDGWSGAGWKRFIAKEGRYLSADDCAKPVDVPLARGRATVFAGPVLGYASCKRAPRRYYAIVHVGGTVIAVNFAGCPDCIPHSPYNSLKGMKAIVRGLELRPKPVF